MAEALSRCPVEADEPARKILFLGDDGVGKTTFIDNYCNYRRDYYQIETYRGTYLVFTQILHYYRRSDGRFPVRLLDLPAGLDNETRRSQYPPQAHSVVLCFSIIEPRSLENIIRFWIPEIRSRFSRGIWMYLVGMKYDRRALFIRRNLHTVDPERGNFYWAEYGCRSRYMESAVPWKPLEAREYMEIFITDACRHNAAPPLEVPNVLDKDLGYYEEGEF